MRGGPEVGTHGGRFLAGRDSSEEKEDQGRACPGRAKGQGRRSSGEEMSQWRLAKGEDGCPGKEEQETWPEGRCPGKKVLWGWWPRDGDGPGDVVLGRRWPRGGGPGEVEEAPRRVEEARGRLRLAGRCGVARRQAHTALPALPAVLPAALPAPAQLGQVSTGRSWGGGPWHRDPLGPMPAACPVVGRSLWVQAARRWAHGTGAEGLAAPGCSKCACFNERQTSVPCGACKSPVTPAVWPQPSTAAPGGG